MSPSNQDWVNPLSVSSNSEGAVLILVNKQGAGNKEKKRRGARLRERVQLGDLLDLGAFWHHLPEQTE